jgi:hypothetical protein
MSLVRKYFSEASARAKGFLSKYPIVDKLKETCKKKGWDAYFVGGFPRDMMFNDKPNDVDIIIEKCGSIEELRAAVAGLGFGDPRERGSFDLHFDVTCNGTSFSMFQAENTYGGVGKDKATVRDVVAAFDFSLNGFIISLQDCKVHDPFKVGAPMLKEGTYYLMTTNRRPYINNRARTILRGLKFEARYSGIWLDELSESWMMCNSDHIRKISIEDFDKILKGLSPEQREYVIRRYNAILISNFMKHSAHFKKVLDKDDFLFQMRHYASRPRTLALRGDHFDTVPFDHEKLAEEVELIDTYFDTPEHSLLKAGVMFRMREKRREGHLPFAEISLRHGRFADHDGLVSKIDDFSKLTEEQRQILLSSMDPLQFSELEPVSTLQELLRKRKIQMNALKPSFNVSTKNTAIVFQSSAIPAYTPFSDPSINVDIAPDLGMQVELRFNETVGNNKTLYNVEITSPYRTVIPAMNDAAALFSGLPTEKTKVQLLYE